MCMCTKRVYNKQHYSRRFLLSGLWFQLNSLETQQRLSTPQIVIDQLFMSTSLFICCKSNRVRRTLYLYFGPLKKIKNIVRMNYVRSGCT